MGYIISCCVISIIFFYFGYKKKLVYSFLFGIIFLLQIRKSSNIYNNLNYDTKGFMYCVDMILFAALTISYYKNGNNKP